MHSKPKYPFLTKGSAELPGGGVLSDRALLGLEHHHLSPTPLRLEQVCPRVQRHEVKILYYKKVFISSLKSIICFYPCQPKSLPGILGGFVKPYGKYWTIPAEFGLYFSKKIKETIIKTKSLEFTNKWLKGHGNEADFLGFLHKPVRYRSLTPLSSHSGFGFEFA